MSKNIEEIKLKRMKSVRKKRRSQLPFAILLTIMVLIIVTHLLKSNSYNSIFWLIGILTGFTLQKSRLCFTASFRDPTMVGSTKVFRAILIGIMVSSIGFLLIQYNYVIRNSNYDVLNIPGYIAPVGVHTAIGGVLFGIGMVIAGGCATGTLMRIGEGFTMQIIVMIGFVIGSLLGGYGYEFWDENFISNAPYIYFPEYVGFEIAAIGQIILLGIIYFIACLYDKKNNIMLT